MGNIGVLKCSPLVSVIVPAYNALPGLCDCINSILNQTYRNIEVIVVDDGSSDGSINFLNSIYDERLRVISVQNGGVSTARNIALDKVSGEYVMFVDADDTIEDEAVEDAVCFACEENLDYAVGGLTKDYGVREVHFGVSPANSDVALVYSGIHIRKVLCATIAYSIEGEAFLSSFFLSGSVCKLIRFSVIREIRFDPDVTIGEDTLFNIQTILNCERIGLISHNWYRYYIHADSATGRHRANALSQAEALLNRLLQLTSGVDGLRPYIAIRGLREFEGACLASIIHKDTRDGRGLSEKVEEILDRPFWDDLFSEFESGLNYIQGRRYRLLARLCMRKNTRLIAGYLRLVDYIRKMRNDK